MIIVSAVRHVLRINAFCNFVAPVRFDKMRVRRRGPSSCNSSLRCRARSPETVFSVSFVLQAPSVDEIVCGGTRWNETKKNVYHFSTFARIIWKGFYDSVRCFSLYEYNCVSKYYLSKLLYISDSRGKYKNRMCPYNKKKQKQIENIVFG